MAETGIILLLFDVGLETDLRRLVRTGAMFVMVATAGFVLPLVLDFSLSYWGFGLSLLVSLFVGGVVV